MVGKLYLNEAAKQTNPKHNLMGKQRKSLADPKKKGY